MRVFEFIFNEYSFSFYVGPPLAGGSGRVAGGGGQGGLLLRPSEKLSMLSGNVYGSLFKEV